MDVSLCAFNELHIVSNMQDFPARSCPKTAIIACGGLEKKGRRIKAASHHGLMIGVSSQMLGYGLFSSVCLSLSYSEVNVSDEGRALFTPVHASKQYIRVFLR